MVNINESYAIELGFKCMTPGSAVRHTTDCAVAAGMYLFNKVC